MCHYYVLLFSTSTSALTPPTNYTTLNSKQSTTITNNKYTYSALCKPNCQHIKQSNHHRQWVGALPTTIITIDNRQQTADANVRKDVCLYVQ